MSKQKLIDMFNGFKSSAVKHSPEILTGIGVAGMITTTVLAVKATPKALRLLEDAEANKGEDLTAPEKVKAAWKPYIPAAITGVVSVGCLIGASSVNVRRNAALATAYNLSQSAFKEYKEKVIETIGEKKEQVVREKVAQDRIEKNPVSKADVIITGKGTTLCYDTQFAKYFESDIDSIKKAVNEVNYRLLSQEYISVNDFYDELGIGHMDIGDELGWNIGRDGMVEVNYSSMLADDGRPCIAISYQVAPRYNYHKLM